MISITNRSILSYILILSIFVLGCAYFLQYVSGHQPCNLCLIERIPYLVAIVSILVILISNKYKRIFSIIITLFFILGTIISVYHIGIEKNIFSETFICELGNDSLNNTSREEILKEFEKKTISCKDVTFKFFGLSLATFNAILSFLLSAIMLKVIKNYGKN
jgi:disulfide bond formation protein DsbB